jgi:hypothetical protein
MNLGNKWLEHTFLVLFKQSFLNGVPVTIHCIWLHQYDISMSFMHNVWSTNSKTRYLSNVYSTWTNIQGKFWFWETSSCLHRTNVSVTGHSKAEANLLAPKWEPSDPSTSIK